ncbi:MAG: hypothetical protein ACI9ZF_001322, partial [Bradyrhizobium sp.]
MVAFVDDVSNSNSCAAGVDHGPLILFDKGSWTLQIQERMTANPADLATDLDATVVMETTVLPPAAALPSLRKLLPLLVLGCLLPGMIGAVVMFRYLFMENNAQLQRSAMEMTRSLMRGVDDEFGQLTLLAVSLSHSGALAGNDLTAFAQEARTLLAATQRSNSIVLSDV